MVHYARVEPHLSKLLDYLASIYKHGENLPQICNLKWHLRQTFSLDTTVSNLGASGAIVGVLGAYILMFPKQSIRVSQGQRIIQVPALIFIGL